MHTGNLCYILLYAKLYAIVIVSATIRLPTRMQGLSFRFRTLHQLRLICQRMCIKIKLSASKSKRGWIKMGKRWGWERGH
jgi:hypothetical protein